MARSDPKVQDRTSIRKQQEVPLLIVSWQSTNNAELEYFPRYLFHQSVLLRENRVARKIVWHQCLTQTSKLQAHLDTVLLPTESKMTRSLVRSTLDRRTIDQSNRSLETSLLQYRDFLFLLSTCANVDFGDLQCVIVQGFSQC